jgi:hypothetical protein
MMVLSLALTSTASESGHQDNWLALGVVVAIIFLLMGGTLVVQWLNRFLVKWLDRILTTGEKNSKTWPGKHMPAHPTSPSTSSSPNQTLLH